MWGQHKDCCNAVNHVGIEGNHAYTNTVMSFYLHGAPYEIYSTSLLGMGAVGSTCKSAYNRFWTETARTRIGKEDMKTHR